MDDLPKLPLTVTPGNELHLTILMARHSLNLVVGEDRAALLAYARDVWDAALAARDDARDADTQRLDWLEQQGLIGIDHVGYGDFRHYAGKSFGPLRAVVDAARGKG